jgi:hypothetical protein
VWVGVLALKIGLRESSEEKSRTVVLKRKRMGVMQRKQAGNLAI